MTRFARRSALARDERGQGLVEFALILPVLLLMLVGIIEFGSIYSHVISMRQGIREAGRQGSVANWGAVPPPPSCTLNLVTPFSVEIKALMCLAKDQAGVGNSVRIKVRYADATLEHYSDAKTEYKVGNAIVICAIYPLQSLTGLIQRFLRHKVATTKAAFRIEKAPDAGTLTPGGESLPSGENWDSCEP